MRLKAERLVTLRIWNSNTRSSSDPFSSSEKSRRRASSSTPLQDREKGNLEFGYDLGVITDQRERGEFA